VTTGSADQAGDTADVIVVGAGPGGSATAAYLAAQGVDVVLLDKATFPRDKICGDGLTPRAVRELVHLGVDTTGWQRTRGLRILGGGRNFTLDWPESATFPSHGLVRTRQQFDHTLAQHAVSRGARLHQGASVTAPVVDGRGRVTGVTAKLLDGAGRPTGATATYRAKVVVAADGVSSRLATAVGRPKREDRVMGVAVRAYYMTPRRDDYLESHLELWATDDHGQRMLMPGYGWIFPLEDGRTNVGLGILDTSSAFGKTDYKDVLRRWVRQPRRPVGTRARPRGWPDPRRRAPDGLQPHPPVCVMASSSSATPRGMVNPFNGEGIDYALEAARVGADVIGQALARGDRHRPRTGRSRHTPELMKHELGGYFTLGRWFARQWADPEIMKFATVHTACSAPRLDVSLLLKVMANLPEEHGGRFDDRLIVHVMSRIVPDA
jgi:geranylgeranyl reductase family protein